MAITLPSLRLAAGELEARFDPAAGMLGCALRHRGEQLLGAGGIPILHPWANRLAEWGYGDDVVLDPRSPLLEHDDNGLPIHGVLRACQRWEVLAAEATALRATLDF